MDITYRQKRVVYVELIRLILFIIFSASQLMLMDHRPNELLFLLMDCRRQKQYHV